MRPRKETVSLAFRLWILATVFVWPFIGTWSIVAWAAAGGALALWWRLLPEDPPQPPPRLPFQDRYEHLAFPPEPKPDPGQAKAAPDHPGP